MTQTFFLRGPLVRTDPSKPLLAKCGALLKRRKGPFCDVGGHLTA